jgi:hypothetical protein
MMTIKYDIVEDQVQNPTIHEDMDDAKLAATFARRASDNQELYTFRPEPLKYRPWDGYYNAAIVIEREFGAITGNATPPSMFGGGEPPTIHTLNVQDMELRSNQTDEHGISMYFSLSHLMSPSVFKLEELIHYAIRMGLENSLPKYPTQADHEVIRNLIRANCTIVGVSSNEVRVPSGSVTVYEEGKPWGVIELGGTMDEKFGPLFSFGITTRKKNEKRALELGRQIADELKSNSIYKGRAMSSSQDMPEYWDVFSACSEESIHLSDDAIAAFQLLIMYPVKYRERARSRNKSMLNRKYLFYGPFGTGKTSINALLAQWAVMHGTTVIRHKTGEDDLDKTLRLARLLEPSLVLVEDMEVETSSGDAAENSKNLDRFDGPTTKSGEIMIVATTNHIDQLEKGMTRPGRIDGIIKVDNVAFDDIDDFTATLTKSTQGQRQDFISQFAHEQNKKRLFDIQDEVADRNPLTKEEHIAAQTEVRELCRVTVTFDDGTQEDRVFSNAFLGEKVKRTEMATLNQENPYQTYAGEKKAALSLHGQFQLHEIAPDSQDDLQKDDAFTAIVQKSSEKATVKVLESFKVDKSTGEFINTK